MFERFNGTNNIEDGWMVDGWVGGWMGGQMDGWMDGWVGGYDIHAQKIAKKQLSTVVIWWE